MLLLLLLLLRSVQEQCHNNRHVLKSPGAGAALTTTWEPNHHHHPILPRIILLAFLRCVFSNLSFQVVSPRGCKVTLVALFSTVCFQMSPQISTAMSTYNLTCSLGSQPLPPTPFSLMSSSANLQQSCSSSHVSHLQFSSYPTIFLLVSC